MKNNKNGITLIALIITILILLILAVVTIGSIKDSNIITYAQNATIKYNKIKGYEELEIEKYEKYMKMLTANEIWEYAWICNKGVWSKEYITDIKKVPSGDGIIAVNFYRKENQITPSALDIKLKTDNAYKLIIEGSGKMGSLYDITRVAWSSEIANWLDNRNEDGYIMAYVTDILIEEGINSIGESAFDLCVSLENIIMPNSLESIGAQAFGSCKKLKEVEIPNSVTTIGAQAFVDCSSLESVIMPKSLINIESSAFQSCISLKHIEIPESVEKIEYGAFINCSSLKSLKIPKSVAIIEEDAFLDIPEIIYNGEAEGSPWGAMSHKKEIN